MADLHFREEKVFKDPVHDYIYVKDPFVWSLINTRAFQRLRRIRQMGTSFLVFHGAEHSRFTHSLGTYEIMRQVLSHFSRNHNWPQDERMVRLALASALLHDIGHGPFSHAFEGVFKTHHETWTRRILMEDREIHGILSQIDTDFPSDLLSVISKGQKFPLLERLIASEMDVDRMDYLLRDALHTGVTYGRFELERLIRIMRPFGHDIVIKQSGMHTVEQYLLARYFMYTQVYLHSTTIGSDVLLGKILSRARDLFQEGQLKYCPKELVPFFEKPESEITVEEFLQLDDTVMHYAFSCWREEEDLSLRDLAARFRDRRLLSSVACRHPLDVDTLLEIQHAFDDAGIPSDSYLSYKAISTGGYLYKQGIKYVGDDGRLRDVCEASKLIHSLVPEVYHRFYYPKDLVEANHDRHTLVELLHKLQR
ncbi:HD domain-containing protein [Collibacillus ludicampi]|uniref:HD domain-containing protein n=1 Tax=Collibacillus ludicampi TaxID=2771369 RepID=A0AAV4LAV0_9BACL|nr:HD domain-containing protein [Collibacillus ludicampi]GIM44816.1 HD domain-containing protein [Collibacillus ludicampi]